MDKSIRIPAFMSKPGVAVGSYIRTPSSAKTGLLATSLAAASVKDSVSKEQSGRGQLRTPSVLLCSLPVSAWTHGGRWALRKSAPAGLGRRLSSNHLLDIFIMISQNEAMRLCYC